MRAIAVSDIHLGWDKSEAKAFRAFLDNLPSLDYFLVLGDFYEMWRRDIVGCVLENRDVLDRLAEIHAADTHVVLVAGNHDMHFVNMGPPANYPAPLQWQKEYRLPVPGRTYVFRHGHQYDPSCQNEALNERLCHSNDEQGQRLSDAGEGQLAPRLAFANPLDQLRDANTPYVRLAQAPTLRRVAEPGLRDDGPNLEIVRQRARSSIQAGEFLVHGHTHIPLVESNYADTGCWVKGRRDYLEIEDLEVRLQSWGPA